MQVEPIKPALNAPGTKRLKLTYDKMLSNVAFDINLRRYTVGLIRRQMETLSESVVRRCRLIL